VGFSIAQKVGDYEVLDLVGTGGMGCVYRVRNVISQRTEAMKVLLADLQAEPELASRFLSEIRTLAALDHPNIAQLHTALQVDNQLLMIMEFVDGMTLQQMAQQAPLALERIINYMHQTLAALSFAHSRGVVHRDIKPANIMVTPEGLVQLTDFGIAKSKAINQATQPGTTMGSLHYMSPEQARGERSVDGRCDIYSLGITMYELLAGCLPFADESAYVLLHNHLNDAPRAPIEVNPRLSKSLNDVILKALEKDPAKRFQSAASFSEALERASGIASTVLVERPRPSGSITPATSGNGPRHVRHRAAATSRFLTAAEGRFWVAARAFAAVAFMAGAAMGFSHVGKATMMVKRAGLAMKQSSSSIAPAHTLVTQIDGPRKAVNVLPDLPRVSSAETATLTDKPQIVLESPQVRTSVQPSPQPKRVAPAAPRNKAETASLSKVKAKVEADDSAAEVTPPVQKPATLAELQMLRTQKVELDIRAAAVRTRVQRLKSQREADGEEGLGSDVAGAYVRMNAYLSTERVDLEEGDVTAAREHMEEASHELNALEGLLAGSITAAKR
jgi:serine/threonine protein kinase